MRFLMLLLVPLMAFFMAPQAALAFGAGIGVAFPTHSGGSSSVTNGTGYAAVSVYGIAYELRAEEKHGRLYLELHVTNDTDEPYSVALTSGKNHDFMVLGEGGRVLWQESDGMAYTQALTTFSVAAHESEKFEARIDSSTYRKFKEDAVLVAATIEGTPYKLFAEVPRRSSEGSSGPATIYGGVIFGDGHWHH